MKTLGVHRRHTSAPRFLSGPYRRPAVLRRFPHSDTGPSMTSLLLTSLSSRCRAHYHLHHPRSGLRLAGGFEAARESA